MHAINLETVLARVARAADDDGLRRAVEVGYFLERVERQLAAGQLQHLLHHALSLGTLHRQLSVVVALVGNGHLISLGQFLYPLDILVDVGSVDDQQETVGGLLVDQQVVHHAAIVVAHHAVENLPDGHSAHIVGKDVVHKVFGIVARDQHLAHVAHVEHTTGRTHGVVLVDDGCVLDGHVKASKGLHQRPQGHMFFV